MAAASLDFDRTFEYSSRPEATIYRRRRIFDLTVSCEIVPPDQTCSAEDRIWRQGSNAGRLDDWSWFRAAVHTNTKKLEKMFTIRLLSTQRTTQGVLQVYAGVVEA